MRAFITLEIISCFFGVLLALQVSKTLEYKDPEPKAFMASVALMHFIIWGIYWIVLALSGH